MPKCDYSAGIRPADSHVSIHAGFAAQGEVLEQQFGEAEVAFRTLDLYTSAVLEVRIIIMQA